MAEKELLFVKTAEGIAAELKKNRDLAGDDSTLQFISRAESEREVLDGMSREGRDLVIGIVGCVKAGKSTFLNALVFDGTQVLPKAATPMTAALTRIQFSDKPKARIVFYKPADWVNIKEKNDRYNQRVNEEYRQRCLECAQAPDGQNEMRSRSRKAPRDVPSSGRITPPSREEVEAELCAGGIIPDELRSSHELVKMVEERSLNVEKHLGKDTDIDLKELNEYVGAGGRFTPIVNYTEISINDPRLKGMEIVDTPGLNDPIVSRERKTVEFLENCDVVFVASSVSQFLVASDIQLLQKKLAQNNIHRAYVVGTQLDSGVLQYKPNKRPAFEMALSGSVAEYEKQAQDVIGKLVNAPSAPSIIRRLADSQPVFVSALMYSVGKKLREQTPLSPDEEHILGRFKAQFADFDSVMESSDDYFTFSNIQSVKDDIFVRIRNEKEAAIRERMEAYTVNQSAELLRLLENVNISVRTRLSVLENADAEALEGKLTHLSEKLNSIRGEISGLFQNQAAECSRVIQNIKVEIAKEIDHHQDMQVETRKEHRTRTEKTGLFGLRKTLIEWDEHIKEVSTSQVIHNVQQYATDAQGIINENFQKLFDTDGLKSEIKNCVIGAFDLASREFDENEILLPLEVMLAGLSVKEVSFDFLEEIEAVADAEFPGGVARGEDIHKLYTLQSKLANHVLQRLSKQLEQQNGLIVTTMNRQAGTFVDTIEGKIAGNIEALKAQLKNKKENIARYQKFITDIGAYKQQLLKFQR